MSQHEKLVTSLTAILRKRLADPLLSQNRPPDAPTYADGVIAVLLDRAARGEQWAIQEIWNRIDGPVKRPKGIPPELAVELMRPPQSVLIGGNLHTPEDKP